MSMDRYRADDGDNDMALMEREIVAMVVMSTIMMMTTMMLLIR